MEIFNNMWNPALAIEPRLQDHKDHLEEVFNIDFLCQELVQHYLE